MKNTSLLYLFAFSFTFGLVVGCVFFIVFQSYVYIMAIVGFIALMSKITPIAVNFLKANKDK